MPDEDSRPEAAPQRALEDWAALRGTPAIWLRAACAAQGWTSLRLVVDGATYDAALTAAHSVESR